MEVSTGTISRWVRGDRVPTPESCDLLADVLGVDLDGILALAGHRPLDTMYRPDDPRNDIISQLPKLTDAQVMVLLDMAESMQKRLGRLVVREEGLHGGS